MCETGWRSKNVDFQFQRGRRDCGREILNIPTNLLTDIFYSYFACLRANLAMRARLAGVPAIVQTEYSLHKGCANYK